MKRKSSWEKIKKLRREIKILKLIAEKFIISFQNPQSMLKVNGDVFNKIETDLNILRK